MQTVTVVTPARRKVSIGVTASISSDPFAMITSAVLLAIATDVCKCRWCSKLCKQGE